MSASGHSHRGDQGPSLGFCFTSKADLRRLGCDKRHAGRVEERFSVVKPAD
jgi:hypothetical protein